MTKFLAIPLGYVLKALYGLLGNYGLTIIIFTVIIRLIILPLYAAQMRSSQQMMEVQPKIKEIQTMYAGNPEKMNEAMQDLYEKHKIHPAMGCLPLLIQLPIIWGLFGLLNNPLKYIGEDSTMVMAVHQSFLWVKDLCQPDQMYLLPIIAGLATYISMRFTMAISANPQAMSGGAGASMKAMRYFMPIMIGWMALTLPSGVSIYWIVSYIFQIFQIRITRWHDARRKEREAIKQRESRKLKQTHKRKKQTTV
ncbi:MAG: YidC/Oxa1 family membrane protein insertase [Anaerovoracaceae bacterium]|jgi:YidC/Oxa1 family membrane protein insertase|nr:YidC/Oxa1 family membrane protein insertase [Bacillota bacterium]MDY2670757.1 YidC/Oxa1 family membrane protein insertase [Anaerovoracaceae bacterium]